MKGLKKISAYLLAAVLLTGCSAENRSAEQVRQRGTLRIAVQQEAQLSELSEHISRSLGAAPEYITADKQTALAMLSEGSADVAVGYYSESENPGLAYGMTTPFHIESIYAVCAEGEFISSFGELDGSLLGAEQTLPESTLRAISAGSADGVLYCTSPQSAGEMLLSGELEAFLCLESRAAELVQSTAGLRCYLLPDLQAERYCAVVLRENSQLYGEISSSIGEYQKGGNTDGIF